MIQTELRELASTPDVTISSLAKNSIHYRMYSRLHRDIQAVYQSRDPADYRRDITSFIGTLPRPSSIIPGTLGSFIFGCLYNIDPSDNIFCSPACSGSIPPPSDEAEVIPCTAQVWTLRNGRLVWHSGDGVEAKVYSHNDRLNEEEVALLLANGAGNVTVYGTRGNRVQEMTLRAPSPPLLTLPATPAQPPLSAIQSVAAASQVGYERGSLSILADWRILLLGLLIIIAIVVVIYFVMKKMRGTEAEKTNEVTSHPAPPPLLGAVVV